MADLTELPFHEFLDQIGRRTPTPGGGSVAAAAGCLATAMARMVATYSVSAKTEPTKRERIESVVTRLRVADQLLRALITQDAEAYARMTAAAKPADGDAPGRKENQEYVEAVLAAIAVPMEMVAVSVNLLAILDEFKGVANRRLLSDLGVAAILGQATAAAAACSVRVNLPELGDAELRGKILAELEQNLRRSAQLRCSVEAYVHDQLGVKA